MITPLVTGTTSASLGTVFIKTGSDLQDTSDCVRWSEEESEKHLKQWLSIPASLTAARSDQGSFSFTPICLGGVQGG